jgi:hypothetical protein
MKRIIASVLAISAVAAAAPAFAQAHPYGDRDRDGVPNAYDNRNNNRGHYRGYSQWQSINSRQANLDRRIDVGIRNGSLTRSEAVRLRAEFRNIAYLESRYRRSNGLSNWERQDLDRRFDRLSARIRDQRHDRQNYRGYHRW